LNIWAQLKEYDMEKIPELEQIAEAATEPSMVRKVLGKPPTAAEVIATVTRLRENFKAIKEQLELAHETGVRLIDERKKMQFVVNAAIKWVEVMDTAATDYEAVATACDELVVAVYKYVGKPGGVMADTPSEANNPTLPPGHEWDVDPCTFAPQDEPESATESTPSPPAAPRCGECGAPSTRVHDCGAPVCEACRSMYHGGSQPFGCADWLAKSLAAKVDAPPSEQPAEASAPCPEALHPDHGLRCEALMKETYEVAGSDPVCTKILDAIFDGFDKADAIAEYAKLPRDTIYEGLRRLRRRLDQAANRRKS
jgi:hypothetical protein